MAQELGISSGAVKMRLHRYGITPYMYIGSAGIYKKADLEAIRDKGERGRPKVEPKGKTAPKARTKKISKKN